MKMPRRINLREIPKGTPINCNSDGKQCIYRAPVNEQHTCDYICKEGKMRGCEPTECTAWSVRKRGKHEKNKS